MENYYKLVPLLKNKFSKTELKELPGWRRKHSLQTPLEMKIESQLPAYINNRSDFNKNPVYPQWNLHSGTTYSPKGDTRSRKSFHYRVKSDQELLKQSLNKANPIKDIKTVYLKKLKTNEDQVFDKVKRSVEDYKEEKRVKRELNEDCYEKINIPVVMYDFLVKDNKDFEFRQGCEEEFFSKNGFRVNQEAAYSERVILKDEVWKDSQESLKIRLKGDLEMKELEEVKEIKDKEENGKNTDQFERKIIHRALKEKKVTSNINKLPKELKLSENKTESLELSNGKVKIKNHKLNDKTKSPELSNEKVKKKNHKQNDKTKSPELSKGEVKIKTHKLNDDINALNNKESKKQEHKKNDEIKKVNKKKDKKINKSEKISDQVPENTKQFGKKGLKMVNIKFKNSKKSLVEQFPTKPKVHFVVSEENQLEEEAQVLSRSKSSVSDHDHSESNDPISEPNSESQENSFEEQMSPQFYNQLRRVKTFSSIKPNKKKYFIQKKTINFVENILEQSEEIMPDELIEYYNRNNEEILKNNEDMDSPVLNTDKKQFKRIERRTKSLALEFKKKKNSKLKQTIVPNNKNVGYIDCESSFSSLESKNSDSVHTKGNTMMLKKAKTALIQPQETNISEAVVLETPQEEESLEKINDRYSSYESKEILKTEDRNSSVPKGKVKSDKLKNPEYSKSTYSKKQDLNIFARKNRKSQLVVSNVPQVKEEPIENSNPLKISKPNKTNSNNLHPQYSSKFIKNQSHSETKSSEISSLKSTLRNFSEKQSQPEILKPEKLKDKTQLQQRPKKQDTSKPEDSQQRSLRSPMPPKQRNSIKFDLKDPFVLKKSPRPLNFQDKPKRRAKKRETFQSLQDSSEHSENSQESESSGNLKKNRNLNTLQYELNLLEKMKKSSPLKQTEGLDTTKKDDLIEYSQSGSSYDAGVDVEKEIGELIKTKHFSINNLAFSGPISFKFAQKMEVTSGVNVNELEVNENSKDHRNQDYIIQKQRFLNWKKHRQLEFDYGLFSLQVKDVEELIPGEKNRKYVRKTEQKLRNEQFFNSKSAFRHRDPNTFSGLAQRKKAFTKKKLSFDENIKTQSNPIHTNMSERIYFRIKNNKSLPNLNHHHSESAQELLNSIKLNMQALEKVYEP